MMTKSWEVQRSSLHATYVDADGKENERKEN